MLEKKGKRERKKREREREVKELCLRDIYTYRDHRKDRRTGDQTGRQTDG